MYDKPGCVYRLQSAIGPAYQILSYSYNLLNYSHTYYNLMVDVTELKTQGFEICVFGCEIVKESRQWYWI